MNLYYHIAKQFFLSLNDIGRITKKISIIGIGLGSFALIISISVLNGFEQKLDEKISNFDGHIRISGLEQKFDISEIELLEGIVSTSFSLDRKGIINHSSDQSVVTFKQVDYNKIKSFYEVPFVGNNPNENEILIGNDVAARLGIRVGDEVIISSPLDNVSFLGFPPAIKTKVSGIFYSKILDYDNKYIFISNNIGKKLFHNISNLKSLDVKVKNSLEIDSIKKRLVSLLGTGKTIESWKDRNSALVSAIEMEKIGSIFVLSLIILVASFSMSSTLSLITIKKIKDIGILRLLGMKLGDIRKIIIFQTLIIGLKGLFWGIVCGAVLVSLQNFFNIISLPSDIYAMETLPMILTFKDIGMVFFINVFIIMIAGISGGKKFLNHDPLELLKWVK